MDEPGMPDPQGGPISSARVVPQRHSASTWNQAQNYPGPGYIPAPGPLRNLVFTIVGIPLGVIVLIAILAAVAGGGSANTATPYPYNGGDNGAALPTQYYSSTTTDPNSGYSPADEPQTQSTLATTDGFGQTPTTGSSDTPTDDVFGTDAGATGAGTPTDTTDTPTASSATTSATTGTSTPLPGDPANTVTAYFAAINAHDYQSAWNLGGKNLDGDSLAHFGAGFSQTQQDSLTVLGVQGGVVTVDLTSQQTDGTRKSYTGTYTVSDGVITNASISQTS